MKFKKYTTSILEIFFFTILVFTAIEIGFYTRDYLRIIDTPQIARDQIKILIISDSVFGDLENKSSIIYILKSKLEALTANRIVFFNASRPANSSAYSAAKIDSILKQFKPDISILLIGNSDYTIHHQKSTNISNFRFQMNSFLYNLRIYNFFIFSKNYFYTWLQIEPNVISNNKDRRVRSDDSAHLGKMSDVLEAFEKNKIGCNTLAKVSLTSAADRKKISDITKKCALLISDLKTRSNIYMYMAQAFEKLKFSSDAKNNYVSAIEIYPQNTHALKSLAWLHYNDKNCAGFISNFKNVFEIQAPQRRALMVLKECYIKEDRTLEGQKYFTELAVKYPEVSQLSSLIAKSFDLTSDTEIKFDDFPYSNNRDFYITKLYFYKKNNLKEEANKLFKERDSFVTTSDNDVDIVNYQLLVSKILKSDSKVFSLQYPNQSDWPIQQAIAMFGDKVNFISLADSIQKKLLNYDVVDLFEDDFMHLTKKGAEIVSDDLSQIIHQKYKLLPARP